MLVMGVLLVLSTYKYKYTNFVVGKENVPPTTTTTTAADTTAAAATLMLLAFAIQSKKA